MRSRGRRAARRGGGGGQELASSSAQLSSVAAQLHEEMARFKLRPRQAANTVVPGLGELTPEQLRQLKALLLAQDAAPRKEPRPAARRGAPGRVLPLDADERGFKHF